MPPLSRIFTKYLIQAVWFENEQCASFFHIGFMYVGITERF